MVVADSDFFKHYACKFYGDRFRFPPSVVVIVVIRFYGPVLLEVGFDAAVFLDIKEKSVVVAPVFIFQVKCSFITFEV